MPTATQTRTARTARAAADTATDQGRRVAQQATGEAQRTAANVKARTAGVAEVARLDARQLAGTAKARAADVTTEIERQGRSLLHETRDQLQTQATTGTRRAAFAIRDLGHQAQALAEGRPEDAPEMADYVSRAADGCYGLADRLSRLGEDIEDNGFTGVLDDLQDYARRRPGAFLLGAALVGFGLGRMVKAQRTTALEDTEEEQDGYITVPAARQR